MTEKNKKKILIAEDEPSYSRALVLKLQNAGFDVKSVENGEDALLVIKKDSFDLLLSDLIMPKMDGFKLLEEIKKQNIKIPIIVLSNLSQKDDEKKIRDAGAVDFLSKSNTPIVDVIKKVENFFNKNL